MRGEKHSKELYTLANVKANICKNATKYLKLTWHKLNDKTLYAKPMLT